MTGHGSFRTRHLPRVRMEWDFRQATEWKPVRDLQSVSTWLVFPTPQWLSHQVSNTGYTDMNDYFTDVGDMQVKKL